VTSTISTTGFSSSCCRSSGSSGSGHEPAVFVWRSFSVELITS
jgi:hypothetical protein